MAEQQLPETVCGTKGVFTGAMVAGNSLSGIGIEVMTSWNTH